MPTQTTIRSGHYCWSKVRARTHNGSQQYEQKKFAIAEVIRPRKIDTKDGTLLAECRDLLTRLAEDRFNLLVVGRFSRGKSTLTNAILGGDLLPTGIVPLTSVITTVRYGSRKQVVLHFTDYGLTREVPFPTGRLCHLKKKIRANVKKIAYAEIELPVEILRRGFFFVDTPGLGSPIIENSLTTERFLPQADAFVLVTSYESLPSEEEDRILHRIRNTNKKLFVVVNKQDTVGEDERDEALNFVAESLKRFSFSDAARIFSISARQALEAKQGQNHEQLEASGIQAFEAELLCFLTEERAQSFLVNMYERTMTFLIQRSRSQEHPEHEDLYKALIERFRDLRETVLGAPSQEQEAIALEVRANENFYSLQIDRKRAGAEFADRFWRRCSDSSANTSINSPSTLRYSRNMPDGGLLHSPTPGNMKASLPPMGYAWPIRN